MMDVYQRRTENVQKSVEERQVQYIQQQILSISFWLKNKIYGFLTWIGRCVIKLLHIIMLNFIETLTVLTVVPIVIFAIWKYIAKQVLFFFVCQSIIGDLPYISDRCALMFKTNDQNLKPLVLSVDSLIEKSVTLAERLSNTDVGTTVKLTEVKISLIDLKTNVLFSQVEQLIKDELIKEIDIIKDSAQSTTRGMHKMLATFNSILRQMERHTTSLYRQLTDQNSIVSRLQSKALTNEQKITLEHFREYLKDMENGIERVIVDAESVNSMLENLDKKVDELTVIASKFHEIDAVKLNQIEQSSFIATLYRQTIGEGNINKVKHQRNLQVLNQFPKFTKEAAIQINNVLLRLDTFKFELDEMKSSMSQIDHTQTFSLNIHIETLRDAIQKLHMHQQRFNGQINEINQV